MDAHPPWPEIAPCPDGCIAHLRDSSATRAELLEVLEIVRELARTTARFSGKDWGAHPVSGDPAWREDLDDLADRASALAERTAK